MQLTDRIAEIQRQNRLNNQQQGPTRVTQTPGGVRGNIVENRYGGGVTTSSNRPGGFNSAYGASAGGGGGANRDFTPSNVPSLDQFNEYVDRSYQSAVDRLDPRWEAEMDQARQQLINQGIDPSSGAGVRFLDDLARRRAAEYGQAEFGAQQVGLGAQNQYAQQAIANDANRVNRYNAVDAANASRFGSAQAAGASRYGADVSRYLGELGNQFGYAQLGEGARQFDVNDVFRSGQQDLQILQSLFGMGMGMDQNAQRTFDQNAGYGNQWWNQIGSQLGQATGGYFTPVDVVGSANAQTNAGRARDSFTVGLLSALGGG